MAASLKNHARVCLTFESGIFESCWILVKYKETPLISDLCERINSRFQLVKNKKRQLVLRLQSAVLPDWESSELLQDEDKITVSVEKLSSPNCLVNEKEDDADAGNRKKRKRTATCSGDEYEPEGNKKKDRRKQALEIQKSLNGEHMKETTNNVDSDVNSSMVPSKTIQKSMKNNPETTDEVVTEALKEKDESGHNLDDSSNDLNNSTKKRKRIRKHRKKKSLSVVEFDFNEKKEREDLAMYKGRNIEKDELFFGSIPDKLVSPKYYRHGYRNLNVYRPDPSKHTKFESDEETTVTENTEQYNFLSSTKLLEEREMMDDSEEIKTGFEVGDTNMLQSGSENRMSTDEADHFSVTAEESAVNSQQIKTQIGKYQDKDNLASNNWNNSLSLGTKDTETFNGYQSDTVKASNSTEFPFKYPNSEPRPARKKASDMPGYTPSVRQYQNSDPRPVGNNVAAVPTQLSRKTLSSGASVFTRQRPNKHQQQPYSHFEMSKEDQLNTVSTNISTIFVNPSVKDPKKDENLMETQSSENQFQESTKKTVNHSSEASNGICQQREMTTAGRVENTVEYSKLPPFKGQLKHGDKIVYKVLEISASCIPEISDYREATVLNVDKDQMVELRNTIRIETKKNKFHVEIEDEDGVLTNTQQNGDVVQLHISSMLDLRMVKSS